jgi:hypothetical protein
MQQLIKLANTSSALKEAALDTVRSLLLAA